MLKKNDGRYVFLNFLPALLYIVVLAVGFIFLSMNTNLLSPESIKNTPIGLIFVIFIELLCVMLIVYFCFCRIEIDAKGVRSTIPFNKSRSGYMLWEDVRSVGVFRTPTGKRIIFISNTPDVYKDRDMMKNDLPLDQLIKMMYSSKRLDAIKRYYQGEIVEV